MQKFWTNIHVPLGITLSLINSYVRYVICCHKASKDVQATFLRTTFSVQKNKGLFTVYTDLCNQMCLYCTTALTLKQKLSHYWKRIHEVPLKSPGRALTEKVQKCWHHIVCQKHNFTAGNSHNVSTGTHWCTTGLFLQISCVQNCLTVFYMTWGLLTIVLLWCSSPTQV